MFDIDFDAVAPAALAKPTKKTHYGAKYMAEWLRKRGTFSTLTKARKKAKVKTMQRVCPSCKGTKQFVGIKYTRDCITCKVNGKPLGHMTPESERRLTAYTERKASGQPMRENTHGNRWDRIAA